MERIKGLPKRVLAYLRRDPVIGAAFCAAVVSAFIVPPSAEYVRYIDFRVLGLLLALMLVVCGLQRASAFNLIISAMLRRVHNARTLAAVMTLVCFFGSMLITNDVALITFVPLTIMLLKSTDRRDLMIPLITLQTVGANLGSMLTPMGNPQNLYIYSLSGMTAEEFLRVMAPPSGISLALLALSLLFIKPSSLEAEPQPREKAAGRGGIWPWCALFLVCIASVLRFIPFWAALAAAAAGALVLDRPVLRRADYGLLLTFVFLFIFVGNIKSLPSVSDALSGIVDGRELTVGLLLSQVISNMPAAMLISGFTNNYAALLVGVDLGGLGTLIASMASVISCKLYLSSDGAKMGRYLAFFTVVNVAFLAVLWTAAALFMKL